MQFTEFTGGSPFELAAIFKIWQDLTPDQRREVEKLPTISQRRDNLLKTGVRKRMLREIMPADFRVEEWIPKVEARIDEIRSSDPELKGAVKGAIDRAEKKLEELAKEKSQGKFRARAPILRRLAINLYMLSQDPRPVAADKLDAFFAALPSWVQSSFDSLPADEARRRLTLDLPAGLPPPGRVPGSGTCRQAAGHHQGLDHRTHSADRFTGRGTAAIVRPAQGNGPAQEPAQACDFTLLIRPCCPGGSTGVCDDDLASEDFRWMGLALAEAEKGRGAVEPNPMVGAVIVRNGEIVGRGHHARFGGPHAEVMALREARAAARGATLYVTLEPCCHHGKTPPCTDAITCAGIARVVAAIRDPFPKRRRRRAGDTPGGRHPGRAWPLWPRLRPDSTPRS